MILGQGYSSFDLVGELPFHELKIYSGLVQRMNQPRGRGIIQAVVEMGHSLGLTVVAEGVESEEEVRTLREIGVHKIQGYFYSKPLAAPDLYKYLEKHSLAKTPPEPRSRQEAPIDGVSF
jgi:EAL domain-containing protein (putative c-di-GMP-specific phosphodiesterase class I)